MKYFYIFSHKKGRTWLCYLKVALSAGALTELESLIKPLCNRHQFLHIFIQNKAIIVFSSSLLVFQKQTKKPHIIIDQIR